MVRFAFVVLLALSAFCHATAQSPLAEGASGLPRTVGGTPSLPDGFYLEPVAGDMTAPVDAAFAPDGQLFVAGKFGHVYRVADGEAHVILDIQDEVLEHGDRGLLGIELDPGFAQNGWMYLLYSVALDQEDRERHDVWARLTRYTVNASGEIEAGSRHVLIGQDFRRGIPACYTSHSPATLAWGTDGTLLVGTGDAASYAGPDTGGLYPDCFGADRIPASNDIGAFRSQSLQSLSGKILRLDPATGRGLPSNPFYTGDPDDVASKVWALGFRNPYRFSVDPASGSTNPAAGDPGRIVYADVGWATWEEVGTVARGDNMGWPCEEGPGPNAEYTATPRGQATCSAAREGMPRQAQMWWHHTDPSLSQPSGRVSASILAGPTYRGTNYPDSYRGRAFYVDYAEGWLATAEVRSNGRMRRDELFASGVGPVVDIAADPASGDLHFVNVWTGEVSRLRFASGANSAPVARAQAATGSAPREVRFTGSTSFDPDGDTITYSWAFGDGDGAASTEADPVHTYADAGTYTARLTVTDPDGARGSAMVTVTVDAGTAPLAHITRPSIGEAVAAGQTVTLQASASDPDGPNNQLQYDWRITLVHNGHQHLDAFGGTGHTTSFSVPFHGASGEVYALRIQLAVTDRDGDRTDVERLVRITTPGEADVTMSGTPEALVMAPTGGGSRSLEVLRDGIRPAPTVGEADTALQYDTYNGGDVRALDWIGYTFSQTHLFSRVTFQEGIHYDTGGWFDDLRVQVRQNGTWRDAGYSTVVPTYRGGDGQHFDTYELVFAQTSGDGIRIAGTPGGGQRFVSAAELRAWAVPAMGGQLPAGWASGDIGPVGAVGGASARGDEWTVAGGGDLWGDLDALHFAHQPLAGDGTIIARLDGLAAAHPWAKAGLMIRDGLGASAAHVSLLGSPSNGLHLQYRAEAGAETEWTPGPSPGLPAWLRLERRGNRFTARVSEDGVTWSLLGRVTVAMGDDVRVGLFATSTDTDGRLDLATASFSSVAVSSSGGGPAPESAWAGADVGPTGATGTTLFANGQLTVSGNGDLWGDLDAFHFAHQPLAGDGILTARLRDVDGANPWAKAGLMVRASLDADAPHAMLIGTPGRGVHLQYRAETAADTEWIAGGDMEAPVWLRLQRAGPMLSAWTSPDGSIWHPVGSATVTLPPEAFIGFAIASTDYDGRRDLATARFDSIRLSPEAGLAPPTANVAAPPPFTIATVFPNPVRGASATVRLGIAAPGQYRVALFDALGRQVSTASIREDAPAVRDVPLALAGSAPGVYVLRVTRGDGDAVTQRITIVR